jgi:hypothetical protein
MAEDSLVKAMILLLVSDPIVRSVLQDTLERAGYTAQLPATCDRQ